MVPHDMRLVVTLSQPDYVYRLLLTLKTLAAPTELWRAANLRLSFKLINRQVSPLPPMQPLEILCKLFSECNCWSNGNVDRTLSDLSTRGRYSVNMFYLAYTKTVLQNQTLTVHFYFSTPSSEKLVFALSRTRTHVSLITSRSMPG